MEKEPFDPRVKRGLNPFKLSHWVPCDECGYPILNPVFEAEKTPVPEYKQPPLPKTIKEARVYLHKAVGWAVADYYTDRKNFEEGGFQVKANNYKKDPLLSKAIRAKYIQHRPILGESLKIIWSHPKEKEPWSDEELRERLHLSLRNVREEKEQKNRNIEWWVIQQFKEISDASETSDRNKEHRP